LTPGLLSIATQGASVVLSWSGDWTLQTQTALNSNPSSWTNVAGAASPYTVPGPLKTAQYFRLMSSQ
jgi:hypothetical protein